ncbi:MAG TPA: hypothetical protein VFJ51_13105 [Nitrososphaeraceae archaeon]|jgi:hypothetical protein|nr:hypothetical protein [Nitrososphaeraceae archaeon]
MSSILIEDREKEEAEGVPVCGANFSTPVSSTAEYIEQIHYTIGNKQYIENAD